MKKFRILYLTSIYQPYWGTEMYLESCRHILGQEPMNVYEDKSGKFKGNMYILKQIYKFLRANHREYTHACYTNAEECIWQKPLENYVYRNMKAFSIIYSAEKACHPYPMTELCYPKLSKWCFLNAGQWIANIESMMDLIESTKLLQNNEEVNTQWLQQAMYFQGLQLGFSISLDTSGNIFQSMAFENITPEGKSLDFSMNENLVKNEIEDTISSCLHWNGHGMTVPRRYANEFSFLKTKCPL